jgi:anti-sigma B factor antagonist
LKIKERTKDDVTVLDISGKIMGGSKVKWINSTGLGLLVSAYTTLVKNGGRMKIAEVSDRIDNILHVTQLELIFETFDKEEEALASFGQL